MGYKNMKKQAKPEYRTKDAVAVDMTEERFKHLREAYLEGQLSVDSRTLAEKIMDFERALSARIKNLRRKSGKSQK